MAGRMGTTAAAARPVNNSRRSMAVMGAHFPVLQSFLTVENYKPALHSAPHSMREASPRRRAALGFLLVLGGNEKLHGLKPRNRPSRHVVGAPDVRHWIHRASGLRLDPINEAVEVMRPHEIKSRVLGLD
jgi:hypothetical protein